MGSACRIYRLSMTEPTVYVIDRVEVRPGHGQKFVEAYLAEYVPGAQARGLTLDHVLVSPPVFIAGEPTVVTAIWSAEGPTGWWKAAIAGRYDPEPADWWARTGHLIVGRTRSSAAEATDIRALCDV